MKALLAEDDPSARQVLKDSLRERGWEVAIAPSAEAAWERFCTAQFPLVIVANSPEGTNLCRQIRALPGGAEIHVLFITDAGPGPLEELVAAGADDYLTHPISRLDLQSRIRIAERRLRTPGANGGAERSERQILELQETVNVQKAFFEELFESAPEGIAVVDNGDRVMRANAEFFRMFGYTRQEAVGRFINDLIAPPHRFEEATGVTDRVTRGERISIETVRRCKDGTELHVSLLAAPVHVHGAQAGTYAIYRDITERVRAREELHRREQEFRALVENAPDIIARFGRDQRILYVSPIIERATGLPPMSFIGNRLGELRLPDDFAAGLARALEQVFEQAQETEFDFTYPAPDGDRRFRACLVPERVAGGSVETVLSIARDVTQHVAAETALRESEERYRRLFEEDVSGDFVATPEGNLLLCNPAFARILGFDSVEEALSSPGAGLSLAPGEHERLLSALRRTRMLELHEMELRRCDGTPVHVIGNIIGSFDDGGELAEIHGYLFDITERKRAEDALRESEQRYRALFDQSPVGVFLCDQKFRITHCNERLIEILGTSREQALGSNLLDLRDPRVQPILEKVTEGEHAAYEARYEGPYCPHEGMPDVWISARVSPLRTGRGEAVGGIGVVEDITHRERAEARLRAQAEELERVNAELLQRTEQAEAAMQARSRLYARMSHELRTPISAIMLYNDLLLDNTFGPLLEEQAGGVKRAQDAAQHLLELVHDILDLSKIEAGKVILQAAQVHVPALLDGLFATVLPLAQSRGSELRVEPQGEIPPVTTDPRRLRQILLNLFSNAVKFGRSEPITVRCRSGPGDGVIIEVADQGVGISPEDLPRIFEDFVQVGELQESGTGLGLAISHRLTELLGGTLEVESVPGVGSTFRVMLPKSMPHPLPQSYADDLDR